MSESPTNLASLRFCHSSIPRKNTSHGTANDSELSLAEGMEGEDMNHKQEQRGTRKADMMGEKKQNYLFVWGFYINIESSYFFLLLHTYIKYG